jgi:hypothetical protein
MRVRSTRTTNKQGAKAGDKDQVAHLFSESRTEEDKRLADSATIAAMEMVAPATAVSESMSVFILADRRIVSTNATLAIPSAIMAESLSELRG